MYPKHCTACGKGLIEGASFCASCGAPLKSEAPSRCPSCGAELAEGASFCARCGASVKGESQGLEKQEKVYPTIARWLVPLAVIGIAVIIVALVLWRIYAYEFAELLHGKPEAPPGSVLHALEVEEIEDLADTGRTISLMLIVIDSIALAGVSIVFLAGFLIRQIDLSQEGVVLKRWGLGPWGKPITIHRLTEIEESRRGNSLKLTGATPEGKRVTRRIGAGEVGRKRWEEFKGELKNYLTPTQETTATGVG